MIWKALCLVLAGALTIVGLTGCVADPVDRAVDRAQSAREEIMDKEVALPSPPANFTLDQAIDYALLHNLTVRAAELELFV